MGQQQDWSQKSAISRKALNFSFVKIAAIAIGN